MSVIARFSVPADQFALGEALEVDGGVRIRLETMIPTGGSMVPYFWVPEESVGAVETALRRSALVERVRLVDDTGPEALFRVEWSADVNGLISAIRESDAIVLEAEGLGDDWSFRLRFPDHQSLSGFYQTCVGTGLSLELDEVNNLLGSSGDTDIGLTGPQREALTKALEEGYFDVPRRITLQDLAEQAGVSDTALSQRLRRGLTTLLSSTLFRDLPSRKSDRGDEDAP